MAVDVTAIRPDAGDFATLFPCDVAQPTTSSVNFPPGGIVANSAIVKLDDRGRVCVFVSSAMDLVLDVNAAWA